MEGFSHLLLALYTSSREASLGEFHERALSLLNSTVAFDSAIWGTGAITPKGLAYHSLHLHNEPPDLAAEYQEVKHQDDAAFNVFRNGSGTLNFHAPALFRSPDKSGIRHYADRFGHQNYIVSSEVEPRSGTAHWISLYRAQAKNEYTERDQLVVALLAPHLREALKINCALHMQRAGAAGGGHAMAIADVKGVMLHAEPGFMELVQAEYRAWVGGPLPPNLLETLTGAGSFRGRRLVVTCEWVKSWMLLKARRTAPSDTLTDRERAVAGELVRGLNHKEIARALHIRPATVRSHISHIHSKLEVHTNAAVAEKLRVA